MIQLKSLSILIIISFSYQQVHGSHGSENIWSGGPPKQPPKLGQRVPILTENYIVKIDEDGEPYIGMSIYELAQDNIKQANSSTSLTRSDDSHP